MKCSTSKFKGPRQCRVQLGIHNVAGCRELTLNIIIRQRNGGFFIRTGDCHQNLECGAGLEGPSAMHLPSTTEDYIRDDLDYCTSLTTFQLPKALDAVRESHRLHQAGDKRIIEVCCDGDMQDDADGKPTLCATDVYTGGDQELSAELDLMAGGDKEQRVVLDSLKESMCLKGQDSFFRVNLDALSTKLSIPPTSSLCGKSLDKNIVASSGCIQIYDISKSITPDQKPFSWRRPDVSSNPKHGQHFMLWAESIDPGDCVTLSEVIGYALLRTDKLCGNDGLELQAFPEMIQDEDDEIFWDNLCLDKLMPIRHFNRGAKLYLKDPEFCRQTGTKTPGSDTNATEAYKACYFSPSCSAKSSTVQPCGSVASQSHDSDLCPESLPQGAPQPRPSTPPTPVHPTSPIQRPEVPPLSGVKGQCGRETMERRDIEISEMDNLSISSLESPSGSLNREGRRCSEKENGCNDPLTSFSALAYVNALY